MQGFRRYGSQRSQKVPVPVPNFTSEIVHGNPNLRDSLARSAQQIQGALWIHANWTWNDDFQGFETMHASSNFTNIQFGMRKAGGAFDHLVDFRNGSASGEVYDILDSWRKDVRSAMGTLDNSYISQENGEVQSGAGTRLLVQLQRPFQLDVTAGLNIKFDWGLGVPQTDVATGLATLSGQGRNLYLGSSAFRPAASARMIQVGDL
ncbi:uncharacterized protein EV422DRAFT_166146 [Fimicolochytrium jonesii]|uniref:uncharacterized protein n=1 Tax=Fimicolochytrium jonesii TaxID=1396493 RepID=UPI0022FEEC71|nr:uncharacterized protein EV422DRAFT_166146 [Fimicolochytrium jonesii]KAI8818809.1 hypothetical protein EV422DRAFT_166146 [Fimicolochytrium jonesii]